MTLPADHLERTGYRLPTEAEWEYACRAGSVAARPYGGSEGLLSEYGWYSNAGHQMHRVGVKKPNDLGLFDVLGNAWEWVLDPYKDYEPGLGDNPFSDTLKQEEFSDAVDRVLRGGAFDNPAAELRSASRYKERPSSVTPPSAAFAPRGLSMDPFYIQGPDTGLTNHPRTRLTILDGRRL